MKYQLVLQWPLSEIGHGRLIEIEDLLIRGLPEDDVDGHDIGSSEANIFVLTDNPTTSWQKIKLFLETCCATNSLRVAYRQLSEEEYVMLWPKELDHFDVT